MFAIKRGFFRYTASFFLVVSIVIVPAMRMLHAEQSIQMETPKESGTKPSTHAQPSVITKYSKFILTILFIELLYLTADSATQESFLKQLHPKMLIKNLALEYSTHLVATIAHEFGHAAMAKGLNDNPIKIHLGSNSGENDKPLLSLPYVSIDGLMPTAGHATYLPSYENSQELPLKVGKLVVEYCKKNNITPSELSKTEFEQLFKKVLTSPEGQAFTQSLPINKKKQAAILLAGGASGILANFILKMIVHYALNNDDTTNAPIFDDITINQLFNMFLPFDISGKGNDASNLYAQCLSVNPSTLTYISKAAPLLDIATEFYLAHRTSDANAQLHSTLLIALINYQLRGFLRFKA